MAKTDSPYLVPTGRLGDVIAAIQALATYKFYKLDFEGWADRISADKSRADHWRRVFEEHPEFFRLDSRRERASLVWRRQYPRRYLVDEGRTLSDEELEALPAAVRAARVSRSPLAAEDIKTLIDAAINLHARALEAEVQSRWWIPLAVSGIGGLIGAIIGAHWGA